MFANLELIYARGEHEDECDFDELRARARGLLNVDWREIRREQERRAARQKQIDRERAQASQEDEMMMDMMGSRHAVVEPEIVEKVDENAKFVTKATTTTGKISY